MRSREAPDFSKELFVLSEDDGYALLNARDFGMDKPGWLVREIIGPFAPVQAVGPLIMVHHGGGPPRDGIGHHPHRYNERLFYVLSGTLDHDDALNGITGHVDTGDVMRLTEGRRGMIHSEWNHSDEPMSIYVLVYETDPTPERAAFAAQRAAEAPRYAEATGVETKELAGSRGALELHGDIRLFADSTFAQGAELALALAPGEGALLSPLEGAFHISEHVAAPGASLVAPPAPRLRRYTLRAPQGGRLLRSVFGTGRGLVVTDAPMPRLARA